MLQFSHSKKYFVEFFLFKKIRRCFLVKDKFSTELFFWLVSQLLSDSIVSGKFLILLNFFWSKTINFVRSFWKEISKGLKFQFQFQFQI
jgi:hypothetical protein